MMRSHSLFLREVAMLWTGYHTNAILREAVEILERNLGEKN